MGNTCTIGPAFAAEEGLETPASMTTQRPARTAVINEEAVETILLDSTIVEAEDDGLSPRRSKGRKGTGFVRKEDLVQLPQEEEEEEEEEPTEDQPPPTKRGGRKATGFVFKERREEQTHSEDESEGEGVEDPEGVEGDEGDAASGNRKKVLFNEGVNETFLLKQKEDETEEPEQLKRTSERKSTGKAVRLSPQELDEIRHGIRIEPSAAAPAGAAAAGPVLLAAPAPQRRGRKPTGRPTEEQLGQAALEDAPARRQKVRKDTGHPSADGKRVRVKRVLAKMFGA